MEKQVQFGKQPLRPLQADKPKSSRMEHNEALAKNLPFLNENDHMLIMSKSKIKSFAPGQAIIRQGMPTTAFYMVRSGIARVERNGAKLAEILPGGVCGEMIVLDGSAASASIVAQDELTADVVESRDLQEIFTAFPHVGSRFFRSLCVNLSKKLRATSAELASIGKKM